MSFNILLTGVGGQGLMLLSTVIGEACVASDIKVVTQEQHGLAQRSGSVSAHVRIGKAYSPLIPFGSADQIIAMEAMEALRYIEYLKPDGHIIMNTRLIHPVIETNELVSKRREEHHYVTLEQIKEKIRKITNNIKSVDARLLASETGNPRTENIVLLGAASQTKGFPLSSTQLIGVVEKIVPKSTIEANLKAFRLGEKA